MQVITRIVPGVDDEHAKNCFHTARQLGMVRLDEQRADWRRRRLTRLCDACSSILED